MKAWLVAGLVLGLAAAARADEGFLKSVSPEDFSAAGLNKLTPEERSRLEALVQQYKTGELADLRQQAEAKAAAARQEAEQKVAAAEAKAKEAQAKADEAIAKSRVTETKAAEPTGKKQPGWFTALLTLRHASEKPEKQEPFEGRLAGDFNGWHGHTVFTLEDGTRWTQQNKTESYDYYPVLHSPKVKIRPAAISGFWMEIEGVNLNVRVIPLELTERK